VIAATAPDMIDEQQRGRLGADTLLRNLQQAGAGLSVGPQAGSLLRAFAPVVPRKLGLGSTDSFSTARADAITIIYVPASHAQSVLSFPMNSSSDPLSLSTSPGCPSGTQVCGLQQGSTALLFDDTGRFDLVDVVNLQPGYAAVTDRQQGVSDFHYVPGAGVGEAESHTYYFDPLSLQLRHSDGGASDVPVIDNVVDVRFEYFGDPLPPVLPKPPAGIANCLYDQSGNSIPMPTLSSSGQPIVSLPLSLFTDGPWCAHGSNRYDADLLRVRMVRVTLRVAVANAMLRGTSADFLSHGGGTSALRLIPDYTIRFDVAPRNMALRVHR
jgi:hypothetical protein